MSSPMKLLPLCRGLDMLREFGIVINVDGGVLLQYEVAVSYSSDCAPVRTLTFGTCSDTARKL